MDLYGTWRIHRILQTKSPIWIQAAPFVALCWFHWGGPWTNDQLGQLLWKTGDFHTQKENHHRLKSMFGTKGIYIYIISVFSEEYFILKIECFINFIQVSSIFIHFHQLNRCVRFRLVRYRDVWCARVDDLAKAEPDGFCAGVRPRTAEPCPDSMERWGPCLENPGGTTTAQN